MLQFHEAVEAVHAHIEQLEPVETALTESFGLVLAEPIVSDMDMPPFDKSAMDGFAVRGDDVAAAPATLRIVEEIPAGAIPRVTVGPGECSRIMTGAPVPPGADTVVRQEDTEPGDDEMHVTIHRSVPVGKNICFVGEDVRCGQVVLEAGHRIRPAEAALLAGCGRGRVRVTRAPRAAVLSTGDEVVPIDIVPQPGQIRDANSYYIRARLRQALGVAAEALGIATDDARVMRQHLESGLEHDVLLTSGSVSAGRYDMLPGVMREAGVELFFEKVAMQPGKPLVFGRRGRAFVFGLPGNPVAVMVAMEMFVLPALRQMMGYAPGEQGPTWLEAELEAPIRHRQGVRSHKPGALRWKQGRWRVRPVDYHGSAHVAALSQANALIVQPPETAVGQPGQTVQVVRLDD